MQSSQESLLAQAHQGDAKAIATLLNQKFQPKGLTVKASVKNGCLHIMLEAAKVPPQQPLVDFIRKGLAGLTVDDWYTVKVYGRRVDEEIPDWVEEFEVRQETKQNSVDLAKKGDIKAITTLINQKLQANGVAAKISTKNDCLQLMLEATEVPSQEQMVAILKSEFQDLGVEGVNSLRIYGKQTGEDFPDWQEEVRLFVEEIESKEVHSLSIELSSPPKIDQQTLTTSVVQEIDSVGLSNQIYIAIQATCYEHLAYRIESENNKTIHEIVEHFVDSLEADLKLDLDQFIRQVIDVSELFGLCIKQTKMQSVISGFVNSSFAGVRLAIRDLEQVTQEILKIDFSQESNALKSFFVGASNEFAANLSGKTLMPKEAMIGAVIGTFIAPGVGSIIGGAIGGWLGGNNQQKAVEKLIERYQKSRAKIFQEWESFLETIYTKIADFLYKNASIKLLEYQAIEQAVEFYSEGNQCLEEQQFLDKEDGPENLIEAVDFYDKAIALNPGFALALNNKACALNRLKKHEEALLASAQAVKIDRTLVVALNNCGEALAGLGRHEEAFSAYEKSVELEPENYSAWWGIGLCLYNLQDFKSVIEVADKLIALDSENFLGWYAKAACQSRLGYPQQALVNLKKAARLDLEMVQQLAKTDSDFDEMRKNKGFRTLMESSS